MRSRATRPSNQHTRLRQQVAAEAARILATEGQRNYGLAKEKAAHRLGIRGRGGLPSNSEIEAELKRYQSLYGGHAHEAALTRLRQSALEAMGFFKPFRPRLVGPVLEGTADDHSRITLHLFCETGDEILIFLQDRGIGFEQERRRIRWYDGSQRTLELVVVEADRQVFELAVMTGKRWKQAPPDPVSGTSQRRAGAAEVARLVSESRPA